MRIGDLMEKIETLAPLDLAESWDNIGLLVGDPKQDATGAVVCLDVTGDAYRMCLETKAQICVCHHPFLFEATKRIDFTDPYYQLMRQFIRSDIAIYAAHTNLDACVGGVNDALCEKLGLAARSTFLADGNPFDPPRGIVPGIGRICEMEKGTGLFDFYRAVIHDLGTSGCHINFDRDRPIPKVLVAGGSYDSQWNTGVVDQGIDVVVSGEIKHRDMVAFARYGIAAIAAGHDATERVILPVLAEFLNGLDGIHAAVCPSEQNKPV